MKPPGVEALPGAAHCQQSWRQSPEGPGRPGLERQEGRQRMERGSGPPGRSFLLSHWPE